MKESGNLRVGLFGIGLAAYWEQFPGLEERLKASVRAVEEQLRAPGREVVNLGLIDSPTSGAYWFMGENMTGRSEEQLTLHRREGVGFVFQNFNLVDDLNVAENVEMGLIYRRVASAERRRRVAAALEMVDLAHRARHMPKQLSGGQQQRVAVARALVSDPKVILADEPTGNLDTTNGDAVMEMLSGVTLTGTTIVMVTHSEAHAKRADRIVYMLDGRFAAAGEI